MLTLREVIRRNQAAFRANALIKGTLLEQQAAALRRRYRRHLSRIPTGVRHTVVDDLQERLQSLGGALLSKEPGSIRILWVGANEAQDHSGFVQGLSTFGSVDCFRDDKGEYGLLTKGLHGAARRFDQSVRVRNDRQLVAYCHNAENRGDPYDLVLGQMWAQLVSVDALKTIRALGVPVVNVSMDDRLPHNWSYQRGERMGSVGLTPGLDLVLTSSPEASSWYIAEGCPSIYWPMASDPELFRPLPEDEKTYDVSFIGNRYGIRAALVARLEQAGVRVATFGNGWPAGPVRPADAATILGRSRISLGVGTVGYSRRIVTLKLRDFDATMAGSAYVTTHNDDLGKLFDVGAEIATYRTIDEAVPVIHRLLAEPERRMAIARSAALRSRRDHTWNARFRVMFQALGLLPPSHPGGLSPDPSSACHGEGKLPRE